MRKIIILAFIAGTLWGCSPKEKIYNILSYGAVSDTTTLNTGAIQNAIDAASASGGGVVVVPEGHFVTGVIHLKSGVELHLDSQAVLLGTYKRLEYGKGDASALIVANGQNNIAITGEGTIDGQAHKLIEDLYKLLKEGVIQDSDWKKYNDWHQKRPEERNRPKLITFVNCDSVRIAGITIKNSSDWVQRYQECSHLTIKGIKVQSTTFLNNDGIDVVDCQQVKVLNCKINAADDGICLKSENPNSLCRDVEIANCEVRSSASAVKIGTASSGGFEDIHIRDIRVYDTYRSAIAIECVDGGHIDSVRVSHISATNTGNAFFIRLGRRNMKAAVGSLQNILIEDLTVSVPHGKPDAGYPMEGPVVRTPHNVFPASITGIPGHPVKNITLKNITVTYEGGAQKNVAFFNRDTLNLIPEKIQEYPEFSMFGELPCWALFVRHAQNLAFNNVSFSSKNGDFRSACIFEDVNGLTINQLKIPSKTPVPKMILRKVNQSIFTGLQFGKTKNEGDKNILRMGK